MRDDSKPEITQLPGHVCEGLGRENEDFLVGDAIGFKSLITACQVALETGEYLGIIGDFEGIRQLVPAELPNYASESTAVLQVNCYPGHMLPGKKYVEFLVGNVVGLNNLVAACQLALEKGEYHSYEIGSFVGIRVFESSLFGDSPREKKNHKANFDSTCFVVLGLFLAGIVYGLYSLIAWLGS